MSACLERAPSDSNCSIHHFDFSVFSVIWGICFLLKDNPNSMNTSDSGTLLAQGTRLRDTNSSKAGALPKTFWHSWHSSTRPETQLTGGPCAMQPSRELTCRLRLIRRTFAGSRTHLQLAQIGRTRERVSHTVSASQGEALGACLASSASCDVQK